MPLSFGDKKADSRIFSRYFRILSLGSIINNTNLNIGLRMIDIQSLSYKYIKNKYIFEGLSAHIAKGEFWGVLGRNGAGKSTLIDLILGLRQPSNGSIKFSHQDDSLESPIAFLSQDISIKTDISVSDYLSFHSSFFTRYSTDVETDLLNYFEIKKESIIASLSTGQKKLVMAIACLSSMTDVLVVDEITAVLDPVARHKFFIKLAEFKEKYNLTIILATNIAEDLKDRVDKILYIEENKSEVLEPSELSGIFEL